MGPPVQNMGDLESTLYAWNPVKPDQDVDS